jgi:hypothetical protein
MRSVWRLPSAKVVALFGDACPGPFLLLQVGLLQASGLSHHHHQTTMQRLHLLQFALGFVLGLSAAAAIVSAAATPSPVVTPAAQRSWPTEFPGP